jgi:hypothetical protein
VIDATSLASVSIKPVGRVAMSILHVLQNFRPEEQCAGLAFSFLLLCRRLGCHPGNAMQVAERMMDEQKKNPELQAVRRYLEGEIPV